VRGRDAEAAEDGEVPPEEFEPSAADAPCTAQEAAATLDLIDEAPAEAAYLAKAREAALAELQALEDMQRALARKRMLKWAAAGLIAPLLLGCVWYLQKQRAAAIAAEPQRPARASAHVALAPPAAPASPVAARYAFAMNLLEVGRAEEAAMLLRRAADAGAAIAQYRLAKLYERGQGVPPDLEAARQWTERAAAGGNRRAMHDLGVYHALGEGAPRDEAAAFRWFRQAAELGVADSQYNLGLLYAQGRGVRANAPEALFWLLVAAGQGDHAAAARIPALEAQITATQAEQARVRARAFRPRAANTVANGDFAAVSQE
jgi:localization factor PodJL